MIITGISRAAGFQLAAYLMQEHKTGRDKAELVELRGFATNDLKTALRSAEIEASLTRCEKPLYHVSFTPDKGEHLTPEQWQDCINRLEHRLKLDDQARAVVMHEHNGEQHIHVVWSRIDREKGIAIDLHYDAERRLETARQIEKDYGLRQLHPSHERTQEPLTRAEYEEARRQGRDVEEVRDAKAAIREAWERSDNGASFDNALRDAGLILAIGDTPRAPYVVVDEKGKVHGIARTVDEKSKAVQARLADLDRDLLPTAEQAKEYQQQREQARADREREEKHRAEVKALTAEILRKTAALKAEKTRQNPEHQPQQQPAQAEKEHGHDTPEPPQQAHENTPQPQEKPRFRYDTERQQFTLADQKSPVMTPEQMKATEEHAKTAEGQKEREAADREARKTDHARTILETGKKAENGLDFAQNLEKKDFILAKKEKGGHAAVHISGMVYNLTLGNVGWTKEQAADRMKEFGFLPTVTEARATLPDWRKEKAEERAQEQATREAAAQAKAIEKRDEADAKAKEKGYTGLLDSRALVRDARKESESGKDFAELLKGSGFELVNSGKEYRPYAIVDHKGRTLDIAYTLGETAKATKEALKDLDPATLRTAKEVQAEVKAHAQEITQAAKDGQKWQECQHAAALQAKENAKPPNIAPEKPKEAAPNIGRAAGRAAGAIGDSVLRLADGLLGGLAGPVTHEQIRQQAAGTQQRTAEQVREAAQQFQKPLTPAEREAKAREFDRTAAEATRAKEAHKAAQANTKGEERRAAMRAEYRAEYLAEKATREAALLRETEQQKQEREAKEREEREAERRRRERQRER